MSLIYTYGLTDASFTSGFSGPAWAPQSYLYGGDIVIPGSGTVTQLGAYLRSGAGAVDFKFGLYDSSGVLQAQSTGSTSSGAFIWLNSGAISASVSAGTYYVLLSASNSNAQYGYSSSGDGSFATEAYATAMAATETITGRGDAGLLYGVRLDFTASASAASLVPNSARRLMSILLPNF